jgi:hypothetical protein
VRPAGLGIVVGKMDSVVNQQLTIVRTMMVRTTDYGSSWLRVEPERAMNVGRNCAVRCVLATTHGCQRWRLRHYLPVRRRNSHWTERTSGTAFRLLSVSWACQERITWGLQDGAPTDGGSGWSLERVAEQSLRSVWMTDSLTAIAVGAGHSDRTTDRACVTPIPSAGEHAPRHRLQPCDGDHGRPRGRSPRPLGSACGRGAPPRDGLPADFRLSRTTSHSQDNLDRVSVVSAHVTLTV